MPLLDVLGERWQGKTYPFLIDQNGALLVQDVLGQECSHLDAIQPGDVVALIGDFNARSISDLLTLIDRQAILVPLTKQTRNDHEYFFESSFVNWVVEDGSVSRRVHDDSHRLLDELREINHAGLVLFSTGTTGRPKAILHDMSFFLRRFGTPRPTLRTLGFLLFDHIGGLNTLLHTIFNAGVVVAPIDRSISSVLAACATYDVEALPTTPTFLRMMLMSGMVPDKVPECLRIITYGTERMDQSTLDQLCELLPTVDFRQTFGMSELGIVRVKSENRSSLFMKIGGEGIKMRISDGVLEIYSPSRMMGYLNAPSPFDPDGWYNTGDVVEQKAEFIKVVGRTTEVINVGGLKFMASEVERVALEYPGVEFVTVLPRINPVTGQHVEMTVQMRAGCDVTPEVLVAFLTERLPAHMIPRRVRLGPVSIGHRFKKA